MKTSLALTLFAFFFSSNIANGQWIRHDDFSEQEISKMLKEFYTNYITTLTLPVGEKQQDKIDSILFIYGTINLFNELRSDWANYTLLNRNYSDVQMLKSLAIQKDPRLNDIYYASYSHQNKKTTINLLIVKLRGKYKIDYVWRDYSENFSEDRIKMMLKKFYVEYITETGIDMDKLRNRDTDWNKVDSLLGKYCTAFALMETADAQDYDPFLKSQMSDTRMIKNLIVQKDPDHNDIYSVTYTYGEGKTTMKFVIMSWNGRFKIDYLWLD
jgi:hypothetical protein